MRKVKKNVVKMGKRSGNTHEGKSWCMMSDKTNGNGTCVLNRTGRILVKNPGITPELKNYTSEPA
jgi:hypothetical protein